MQAATIKVKLLGEITLFFEDQHLIQLEFGKKNTNLEKADQKLVEQVKKDLDDYFENPKHQFRTLYQLNVTPFQKKVLNEMRKIPAGKALTYGELAKRLKTAPRAVGGACRSNPLPIIFPCHRIVAQNGLGGYSGAREGKWLNIKQQLLKHENYDCFH